jgi:basic amino acid/polyamine antiporter, APA family
MSAIRKLNFWDATLIVAGSMIGSGIFIVSADMTRTLGGGGWLIALWVLSGLITVMAALSYGELAGMFPHAGGQYVYLKEAFNPLVGFLYGWTLFLIVQSGTIAAVAVAFAKFTAVLFPVMSERHILFELGGWHISAAQILGVGSLLILTIINSRGIHYGKIIVRIFSSAKIIALLGLIIAGLFLFGDGQIWQDNMAHAWDTGQWVKASDGSWSLSQISGWAILPALGVALVGSLFSSDAWNNVTFISGDIQDPKRNIPLSLFVGTMIVSSLYILANVAYLRLLPLHGDPQAGDILGQGIQFASLDRVGTAAASRMFGIGASAMMAVLIMVSTFSCNNGIVLSSVRVYQAMARDGLFFARMRDDNAYGVPSFALWVQFVWASILCLWGIYGDLLDYVMFAVMLFYILTIIGIFILRRTRPDAERPYRAFGYPVIPILYIIFAALFCLNLLYTKPGNAIPGLLLVLAGIPVYYLWRSRTTPPPTHS